MARTKQTARYAIAPQSVPRSRPINPVGRNRNSRSRSSSQESHRQPQINAQQFSVKFDNQKECEKKAIPFKVVECPKCGSFLNSMSTIIEKESRKSRQRNMTDVEKQLYKSHLGKEWECQFCMAINSLPEDFEKLPQENQCYLLEKQQKNSMGVEQNKENMLIYCIDVSGSMDEEFSEKTRLEAVKQALIDQLKRMKFEKEKIQVGIITFGSLVSLFNNNGNINIPAQNYNNFQAMVKFSKGLTNFSFSINETFKDLKTYIGKLQTYGSTALGPGLLASIELASTGKKGSKIIICTDGEANIGLNGPEFYTRAADYAKQKGVVVNILSIKGDRCNLKELGKLTLSTGGSILKIDPNLLGSQFNKITKEEVLGSESTLKIIVNKLFQIENGIGNLSKDKTSLIQNYGSFSAETQLTFNFKVLSKEQATAKGVNYDLFLKKKAPMQVQLSYTTPDGAKYLQVITDYRQLSQNQEDIFKDMNFGLFSASTLQKVSGLIKQERFQQAQAQIKTFDRVVADVFSKKQQDQKKIEKFTKRIRNLEKVLNSKKSKKTNVKGNSQTKTKAKTAITKTAMTKTKTKTLAKKNKRGTKPGKGAMIKDSQSEQGSPENDLMESDNEQELLFREMRARSVSRSRSRSR